MQKTKPDLHITMHGTHQMQVFVLRPGDSAHGFTADKNGSIVLRSRTASGTVTTEHEIDAPDVWRWLARIMECERRRDDEPLEEVLHVDGPFPANIMEDIDFQMHANTKCTTCGKRATKTRRILFDTCRECRYA